jgi:beta-N-acetylhexosaminidase
VSEPREVLSKTDFAPFRALSHLPAAMTAHVVFRSIDPDAPASTSEIVTCEVIRGEIGFDGLLMSDDLTMRALSGSMRQRAERVIAAGSDLVLHCSGDMAEMQEAAAGSPALAGPALRRFAAAARRIGAARPFDSGAAAAALDRVLAAAGAESV